MNYNLSTSPQMAWMNSVILADKRTAISPTPGAMYSMLEMYYLNNGLYEYLSQFSYDNDQWSPAMLPIRNPANRAVEFYPHKLWPGQLPQALPIITTNKKIIDPIHKIWEWSNWGVNKQLFARRLSLYGDVFLKIATKIVDEEPQRVYFQNIKPHFIVDLEEDDRGFLVYIRVDIPQTDGKDIYTYTEVWSKSRGDVRVYRHKQSSNTPEDKLGNPVSITSLEKFGIDFIPFVHCKFIDNGEPRGLGVFTTTLDKIDETNRIATRLHQIMYRYNKPLWTVSANGVDKTGRPLPGPIIGGTNSTDGTGNVDIKDDEFYSLPGNSSIHATVPQLAYDAHIREIGEMVNELERDLPELAYYRIREKSGEVSGRAVRLMLSDVIDKVKEVRGNAETALARANEMALTISQNIGLFESTIGSYEAGDFKHTFAVRPVIPRDDFEEYDLITLGIGTGLAMTTILKRVGWSDKEIAAAIKEKEKESQSSVANMAQALLNQQRNFDRGENENPSDSIQEDSPPAVNN